MITVGLVQINNSFSGQNYLPYSVGLLQAYVQKNAADPSRYRFLPAIYKRDRIGTIVEALREADIVGFSTYVWNARISLEIARRLKAVKPGMVIVFGGPHVPDKPEEFIRANPEIDLVVHNEGEKAFLWILENFPSFGGVKTIRYDRVRDLDEVPSPFLEGTFDALMAANPAEQWIGLWETNRGCPFKCTFCDWGSATAAKVTKFGMERLAHEVAWFADHKIEYIFCCDANFGIQKRDVDIATRVAATKGATGYPVALSVQNTKNATERAYETQKILSDAGLNKGVALSMQSVDPGTLVAVKRDNISLNTYAELQRRFTKDGVETYSDLILGLPGETYDSFADGVDTLIRGGQHNRIQFNNLSILPNAEMANPAYRQHHGLVTVESRIINIHGERVALDDDVPEIQDLVVATTAMPASDWRRTRAFCWWAALLHFDKLLQIPLIVAHGTTGISYRAMIEAFMDADEMLYPNLAIIGSIFEREARSIQHGGPEYVLGELGIYWPADEHVFITMTKDGWIADFYNEALRLLTDLGVGNGPLVSAVGLNRLLLNQPHAGGAAAVALVWNVLEYWQKVKAGEKPTMTLTSETFSIDPGKRYDDFSTWCREIVWWGNKKGAYLYTPRTAPIAPELAGHY